MNLNDFYRTLKNEIAIQEKDKLLKVYQNKTDFTFAIFEILFNCLEKQGYQGVHKNVDKTNKRFYQKEYYNVDLIGWTCIEKFKLADKDHPLNTHLWQLDYAIEHENNNKDFSDEVIKLMNIDCPLRIVIVYNDSNSFGNVEIMTDMVNMMNKLYKTTNKSKIPIDAEFGILLGKKEVTTCEHIFYTCYTIFFSQIDDSYGYKNLDEE